MSDGLSTSFGRAAGDYERGRPDYPTDAVAWMLEPAQQAGRAVRVADVGAGTGKLTRVLVDLGADAVAVDPDPDMLTALHRGLPTVPTFPGSGERLPLPDGAVDAVVFGQAWHWVDPAEASVEVTRVLRPGGILGLVWNIRDESVPWVRRLTEIMHGSHAEELLAGEGPVVTPPLGALEERTWTWSRPVDRATLTAMVRSRSYIITAPAEERERIETAAATLFDEVGAVGDALVDLPYRTHAFRSVRP
jgi:SAM-dependent methyltransferase